MLRCVWFRNSSQPLVSKRSTVRALVVDDSRPTRGIIAKMMRELDFETQEASNGQEALTILESEPTPDLVTVNWHMPGMDGLELVTAIRKKRKFHTLPLLMISGEMEEERIAHAMLSGISGYIIKPCTPKRIADQLQQLGFNSSHSAAANIPTAAAPFTPVATGPATKQQPIKVLVVDDSAVVRRAVTSTLESESEIHVVGTACNGQEALKKISELKPDAMLLDVEMPVMDGLETLRQLRSLRSTVRVLMFSSRTQRGAKTATEALLLGAKDFIFKPGGTEMSDITAGRKSIRGEVVPKLKALFSNRSSNTDSRVIAKPLNQVDVVVIGSSTGGPAALARIFADPTLGTSLHAPIVVAQHMPQHFTAHLAARLAETTGLDIAEAVSGEVLEPGMIRLGPGGVHHVQIHCRGSRMTSMLNSDPPVNSCRPSADVLFASAARSCGARTLGVVLTGIGHDGTAGCQSIIANDGRVIVQNEESSVIWGMPGSVANKGLANMVLPLPLMGGEIGKRLRFRRDK
ncbi:MAG: chemotaxis-specific protein-glutamate methyltransferase CheB [Rubripirellula sp.]